MNKLLLALLLMSITSMSAATEIEWKTPQEVDKLMQEEPKKVLVDFYTSWCGWCKVMDKNTYSDENIINYINENFYAIKFDAESKDSFEFQGEMYKYNPKARAHEWAITYLGGRMSYPTTLFLLEGFQTPMAIPGYIKTPVMEVILSFINTESFKTQNFEDYQKTYESKNPE